MTAGRILWKRMGTFIPKWRANILGDTYYQPSVLYRNLGNGKFRDISDLAGPDLNRSGLLAA